MCDNASRAPIGRLDATEAVIGRDVEAACPKVILRFRRQVFVEVPATDLTARYFSHVK